MPKQPNQIIGSFVFRNEGDGCLTSKYHHGDSTTCPFTEACKLTTPPITNDIFIGTYRTVWIEDNGHVESELTIRRHPRNNDLFELHWRNPTSGHLIFEGTGMIFERLLIGAYWD